MSLMYSVKANILIDETHRARLADFGLLTIISESTSLSVSSSSFTQGGTHRWMSPELFLPQRFGIKDGRPTKQSDCYALGMVVYEVLRGKVPFYRDGGYIVIAKVIDGHRPGRPRGREGTWFTDDIWSVLEHCWKPKPGDRPGVPEVLRSLKTWMLPSPQSLALADLATTKSPMWNSDSNAEEGTDESTASSPSHVLPLQGDLRCKLCVGLLLTHLQTFVTGLQMTESLEYTQRIPVNRIRRNLPWLWIGLVGRAFSTDFLCRLIIHQAPFAHGHSLGASPRRRGTRSYKDGSPQLNVRSGLQLSVG